MEMRGFSPPDPRRVSSHIRLIRSRSAVIQRPGRASLARTQTTAGPWDPAEAPARLRRGSVEIASAATTAAHANLRSSNVKNLPALEVSCSSILRQLRHREDVERELASATILLMTLFAMPDDAPTLRFA